MIALTDAQVANLEALAASKRAKLPHVGDRFRISTARLYASGVVRKVNRVNFVFTDRYFEQTMTLRLPLSDWQDAEVIYSPSHRRP